MKLRSGDVPARGLGKTRSLRNRRTRSLLSSCYMGCVAGGRSGLPTPMHARPTPTVADYASPLELLVSPDGARLYVLCQQSEEVRVLDAATFALIKTIAVGRVPRGMASLTHG